MDDKKRDLDELGDLEKFSERYNHYLQTEDDEGEKTQIMNYTDISSFGDGSEVFYSSSTLEEEKNEAEVLPEPKKSAKKTDNKEKKKGNFFSKNHYHNTKVIALCLVIALLLSAGGFLAWLVYSTKSEGYGDEGIDYNNQSDSDYIVDDNHDFEAMGDIDADSLNKYLYEWANNGGEKMYSKNVVNVLLCGVDSVYNLCDAQILVSVNKKTEKIKMISFLRDSWTYIRMPNENGKTYDYYDKVNAAYHGGPATLMTTIENNYKIEIDQYIVVDFKSFPKLIDALGGVEVEVQQYESDYIRRTSKQTDFPVGKAKLNGKQALIYSRIRKCDADSDLSRTRRQRSVIKALIASAKTATKGQLVNAFKQVSGYLRTGYSQSEVISLIAQAVSHDWMDFEITEVTMPNEDYVDRMGGYIGSAWAWTVDYPVCAQKIQKEIYGETNIVLKEDRVSALDYVTNRRITSDSSNGSTKSYTTSYYNNNYSGGGNSYGGSSYTQQQTYTQNYEYTTEATEAPVTETPEVTERTRITLIPQRTEATVAPTEAASENVGE